MQHGRLLNGGCVAGCSIGVALEGWLFELCHSKMQSLEYVGILRRRYWLLHDQSGEMVPTSWARYCPAGRLAGVRLSMETVKPKDACPFRELLTDTVAFCRPRSNWVASLALTTCQPFRELESRSLTDTAASEFSDFLPAVTSNVVNSQTATTPRS